MKADQRTPIDIWPLLVWAYKRHMVNYELPTGGGPSGYGSSWDSMWLGVSVDASAPRGTINAVGTTAHPDAHALHAYILAMLPWDDQRLIIDTASKGRAPDWNPHVEPHRVVPVRKGGNGACRMLYRNGRPIACLIDYEGVSDVEARAVKAAARQLYLRWWKLLRRLCLAWRIDGRALTRWKVADIGAARAPWMAPAGRVAVNV